MTKGTVESKIIKIKPSEELRRRLVHDWVRKDGTIDEEAFCPRLINEQLEEGVSVSVTSFKEKSIKRFNQGNRFSSCVLLARTPNELGYKVVHKPIPPNQIEHAEVNSDMAALSEDEDARLKIATASSLAYHPPNQDLVLI
ncbi:MAG: hypothetical protein JKY52_06200 [Flavobacteriales bacterium]|nr:hypothetical protein [Flavobacteriales bacterium]